MDGCWDYAKNLIISSFAVVVQSLIFPPGPAHGPSGSRSRLAHEAGAAAEIAAYRKEEKYADVDARNNYH